MAEFAAAAHLFGTVNRLFNWTYSTNSQRTSQLSDDVAVAYILTYSLHIVPSLKLFFFTVIGSGVLLFFFNLCL